MTIFGIVYIFLVGDFHFEMHFCAGLYRLGFGDYLLPIADKLQYTNLFQEFKLKQWNRHDEFLLLFTTAGVQWLLGMLQPIFVSCVEI